MKKVNLSYLMLVIFAIFILLIHYPRIYGTDSFQVIWMANALREGALFSNNTWLIHPTSYFGYYPFSHRAIGIPLILAFIMSFLEFVSFGNFGIAEAILTFNIILILIIYKSSRNLGNILFKEEWSRFVFVAAIILSQYMLDNVVMTVSTRVIITIIMINVLNLNVKILTNSISIFKAMIFLGLLVLVGALMHRLWIGTIIAIIFTLFTVFIRKYKNFQKLTVFLLLPLSIIAFFIGLEILNIENFEYFLLRLDPNHVFSSLFGIDVKTLLGTIVLLSWFFAWNVGLICIFLPLGVILTLYKLSAFLKNSNYRITELCNNKKFLKEFYLILFIVPFFFLTPFIFYSIIIFLPILIIFSIYGIIYLKNLISTYSETFSWFLLIIPLLISIIYSFLKAEFAAPINLWYVFAFSTFSLILLPLVFVLNKYKNLKISKYFYAFKIKKEIWALILTISMSIFSITTILTNRVGLYNNPYPWQNRSLTDEEIKIIEFFHNEEIDGLIFTFDAYIDLKISGVGFLPTFHGRSYIGIDLWYGLINPNEVLDNTEFTFSFSNLLDQSFFRFWPNYATFYYETSPLEVLKRKIIKLNITIEDDKNLLRYEYNVQFVISTKEITLHESNEWLLIQTLFQSELEPVYTTQNLVVWKIN